MTSSITNTEELQKALNDHFDKLPKPLISQETIEEYERQNPSDVVKVSWDESLKQTPESQYIDSKNKA